MIRKYFPKFKTSGKEKIAWRSHEPSRIEAFSDAVFAFTVSLLVFSLEVPKSSEELLKGMHAFLPFSLCFAFVFYIWYAQYKFFRHYGLHDMVTIILNAVLMVTVLFYVYPLKFIIVGWIQHTENITRAEDVLPLLVIYNGGFAFIHLIFTLLYCNAYARREELKLTQAEIFETVSYIYHGIAFVSIGIVIVLVAVIANRISVQYSFVCFMFYGLIGPVMSVLGRKRDKLFHKKFGKIPVSEPELGAE